MIELKKYAINFIPEFVKYRDNENISINGFDKTPTPYSIEYATELFHNQINKTQPERFLIFYKNQLCGEIGVVLKEDIFRLNAEIGYFVAETFWGKGIATEAIRLITNYAFETFNIIRIVASVFEYNKASMKALEKNNYIVESIQKNGVIKNGKIVDNYIWVKHKE